MRLRALIPTLAVAAVGLTPAAASADTLLAATPEGSQNLAAAGGYTAWAQPNQPAGSGFRIVVRTSDGTVSTPNIPVFEETPDPAFGTDGVFGREVVLVYSRAGDVYTYSFEQQRERKVAQVSSKQVERSPAVRFGVFTFVRVSGPRAGVYRWSRSAGLRRVSADIPRELAFNGSRVAYPRGNAVVVRRVSGRGQVLSFPTGTTPSSVILTRYRATWLAGGEAFKTQRFGSGDTPSTFRPDRAERAMPAGTNSIAFERDRARLVLDREGVKRLNPSPFGSRG